MRALAPLLLLLTGCSSGAVTIHNGSTEAVQVVGLDQPLDVAAGERVRIEHLRGVPALSAVGKLGEVARIEATELTRGGQAVWVLGEGVCYAEADYAAYYMPDIGIPAGVVLLGAIEASGLYVSKGVVDAGPGERLPKKARDRAVALVEVPCQANRAGEAILTSWLEVALQDIQPN